LDEKLVFVVFVFFISFAFVCFWFKRIFDGLKKVENDREVFGRFDFRLEAEKLCMVRGEVAKTKIETVTSLMFGMNSDKYKLCVEYTYKIDGKMYTGVRTPFSASFIGYKYAIDDLCTKLINGAAIDVFYQKDNPNDSFAIFDGMYDYPRFNRREMLEIAKRKRAELWGRKPR